MIFNVSCFSQIYVVRMCVCMCVCTSTHVCAHACEHWCIDQSRTFGTVLCYSPSYFLRWGLSLNLECSTLARLDGQRAPEMYMSPLTRTGPPSFNLVSFYWDQLNPRNTECWDIDWSRTGRVQVTIVTVSLWVPRRGRASQDVLPILWCFCSSCPVYSEVWRQVLVWVSFFG